MTKFKLPLTLMHMYFSGPALINHSCRRQILTAIKEIPCCGPMWGFRAVRTQNSGNIFQCSESSLQAGVQRHRRLCSFNKSLGLHNEQDGTQVSREERRTLSVDLMLQRQLEAASDQSSGWTRQKRLTEAVSVSWVSNTVVETPFSLLVNANNTAG